MESVNYPLPTSHFPLPTLHSHLPVWQVFPIAQSSLPIRAIRSNSHATNDLQNIDSPWHTYCGTGGQGLGGGCHIGWFGRRGDDLIERVLPAGSLSSESPV